MTAVLDEPRPADAPWPPVRVPAPRPRPDRPPDRRPVVDWVFLVVVVASRTYRAWVLTLTAVALLPILGGWGSYVIESGSMEPSISVGDVVVAKPTPRDEQIRVGRVFVLDDPATDEPHLLVHRVVALNDDGTYTTAGDANDVTDVTPLPRSEVRATAVLLSPYVGLPVVWAQSGHWFRLLAWVLITCAAFVLAGRTVGGGAPPTRGLAGLVRRGRHRGGDGRAPRGSSRALRSTGRRAAPTILGCAAALVLATCVSTGSAAFTDRTGNGSSAWKASSTILLPYTAAAMQDAPSMLWNLDETTGTQGTDRSGNNRLPLMTGVTLGVPGATPTSPSTATRFDGGGDRIVSSGPAVAAPGTFSVELWFKKTSGVGGKLVGFESTQGATSAVHDRMLYIRSNGRLSYGWSSSTSRQVESIASYNDATWHHVVVVATGAAASMYVDGALVSTGTTDAPLAYTGWWRVGFGSMPNGNFPNAALNADVDNVAVYPRALTPAQVLAHYQAR